LQFETEQQETGLTEQPKIERLKIRVLQNLTKEKKNHLPFSAKVSISWQRT
jgi:hypothetical protein